MNRILDFTGSELLYVTLRCVQFRGNVRSPRSAPPTGGSARAPKPRVGITPPRANVLGPTAALSCNRRAPLYPPGPETCSPDRQTAAGERAGAEGRASRVIGERSRCWPGGSELRTRTRLPGPGAALTAPSGGGRLQGRLGPRDPQGPRRARRPARAPRSASTHRRARSGLPSRAQGTGPPFPGPRRARHAGSTAPA